MNSSKRDLAKVLGIVGAGAVVWKKPIVDTVILPAHATTSPPGCQVALLDGRFADFGSDNYLPIGSPVYLDSNCSELDDSTFGRSIVYAPSGEEEAESICQERAGVSVRFFEIGNVWFCNNS